MSRMVATTIYSDETGSEMVYHNTKVATFKPWIPIAIPRHRQKNRVATVKLDTGGYYTTTTKKRMNQFAEHFGIPFYVYQEKGVWYVNCDKCKDTPRILTFNSDGTLEFVIDY